MARKRKTQLILSLAIVFFWSLLSGARAVVAREKETSIFYPPEVTARAKANVEKYPWAAEEQKKTVAAAERWARMSDEELWGLMFSHTVERAHHVWSNGYCPACKEDVLMYSWKIDAWKHPWKVQCPHCGEFFPKNDFYKFYLSGLDEHGIFSYELADRSLLYNEEHPDPSDPLHNFGVDGGKGYNDGKNTWRFIAAYIVYGQWKQKITAGITNLANAYVVTGDPVYAHKAGVLLDRVADLYPKFDFLLQGQMYEQAGGGTFGYVTYWQQAGQESQAMALAFDKIRGALRKDKKLVRFLSEKSLQYKLKNPKASYGDIKRNIFDRILQDSIEHPLKIHNNFPLREIATTYMKTVMHWPRKRKEIMKYIRGWMTEATGSDGVTGEKGWYSGSGPRSIAEFLEAYNRFDDNFIREMTELVPNLRQTYRFHIDIRVLDAYTIWAGDGGNFGQKGFLDTPKKPLLLWKLYEITGDPVYVRKLYEQNGYSVDGLPHDLFYPDPEGFQQQVKEVIDRVGTEIKLAGTNKTQWHLAILRSGEGADARAAILDYDSGGRHGHYDGMQIGLYAKGLNLMPDLGYPPVQFTGWRGPKPDWYALTAAHATVEVDGEINNGGLGKLFLEVLADAKEHNKSSGESTLWADGKQFSAVRASGAHLIRAKQYERTVALVDISDKDSYVVDVFRVVGGKDHAKFMHSSFGTITTRGLSLKPAPDYGHDTLMRNFQTDPAPEPGWSVDWKIEDFYNYLPADSDVHLRYTDLTIDAQATTTEGWLALHGCCDSKEEAWIPRVMVRRQSKEAPLASTFVAVIEPYEKKTNITQIRRLGLQTPNGRVYPDSNVAIEVQLADGRKDRIIAADAENPLGLSPSVTVDKILVQKDWDVYCAGQLCLVRFDRSGKLQRIVLCRGKFISVGDVVIKFKNEIEFVEVSFDEKGAKVVSSNPEDVQDIMIKGLK